MIETSTAITPIGLQEFQNSDLGEVFSPPGGGLSLDALDRCRADYSLDDYEGQHCDMGVDVGTKLHVVIREHFFVRDCEAMRPLWWAGTVDSFDELGVLMDRFHIESCVIDGLPETHKVVDFAREREPAVTACYYTKSMPGAEFKRRGDGGVPTLSVNRVQMIDDTAALFRAQRLGLPRNGRALGGRVREGMGEYYRKMLAPQRTLEQDTNGNWVARWSANSRADHYTHAEVYCRLAHEVAHWHSQGVW